jgi:hypothetical protein
MAFKMKGSPFQRNFGTFEEQKAKSEKAYKKGRAKATEGLKAAKKDYDSGYKEGITNVHHPKKESTAPSPKKKWWQRKPKGKRNKKTWWNPLD